MRHQAVTKQILKARSKSVGSCSWIEVKVKECVSRERAITIQGDSINITIIVW